MAIICITGKMASGKNYICSQYEKDGWFSVDADRVVHEAVEACKSQIIETFGKIAKSKGMELLDVDGKIIRRNLGSLIFGDDELLKKQEDIVYPYVTKYIKKFIEEHNAAQTHLSEGEEKASVISDRSGEKSANVIINAVALYKTPELLKLCEKIIYVKSSFIKRLVRAHHRDKMPIGKIIARFKQQRGLYEKYAACAKENGIPFEIIKN